MRRHANVRAVGLRPRNLCVPDAERAGLHRRQQQPLRQVFLGEEGPCIRRGVRPEHARRGWSRNLGGPRLSAKQLRCCGEPVRGLRRTTRRRVHVSSAHVGREQAPATREAAGKGNRSRGRRGQGVGGLQRRGDVGDRGGTRTRPSTGGPCWWERQEGPRPNAVTVEDRSRDLCREWNERKTHPQDGSPPWRLWWMCLR